MKVIFLDVDGVLNNQFTFSDISHEVMFGYGRRVEIEEEKVGFVKEIVDATDAKIVLSSTWRCFFFRTSDGIIRPYAEKGYLLKEKLDKYGLEIYDVTGYDTWGRREEEIKTYIENNGVRDFVIIDDCMDDEYGLYADKTIKTKFYGLHRNRLGLLETHIPKAIDILNRKVLIK